VKVDDVEQKWHDKASLKTQKKDARYVDKVSLPLDQELNPALPKEEAQFLITQIN